jgi:DNA gyrase subunit A
VREHEELVFISENGMVQRTGVRGISRYGRMSQGVRVMNVKDEDRVSAIALVVESEEDVTSAEAAALVASDGPIELNADGGGDEPSGLEDRELAPEEAVDPEAAEASDAALEGTVPGEPDEVDLDDVDGPPTPGA